MHWHRWDSTRLDRTRPGSVETLHSGGPATQVLDQMLYQVDPAQSYQVLPVSLGAEQRAVALGLADVAEPWTEQRTTQRAAGAAAAVLTWYGKVGWVLCGFSKYFGIPARPTEPTILDLRWSSATQKSSSQC